LLKRVPIALDPSHADTTTNSSSTTTTTTTTTTTNNTTIPVRRFIRRFAPGRQPNPHTVLACLNLVGPLPDADTVPVPRHRPAILHRRLAVKLLTVLQCDGVKMPGADQAGRVVNLFNISQRQRSAGCVRGRSVCLSSTRQHRHHQHRHHQHRHHHHHHRHHQAANGYVPWKQMLSMA